MRRRRRSPSPGPFSPEEDETLREMVSIGLDSTFWKVGLPHRPFGDLTNRILELRIPRAPLI